MSPPNSDFTAGEFGDPDFATAALAEDAQVQDEPVAPPAPQYRKKGFDIYSVLLICSFVFLLVAMILMFREASLYT